MSEANFIPAFKTFLNLTMSLPGLHQLLPPSHRLPIPPSPSFNTLPPLVIEAFAKSRVHTQIFDFYTLLADVDWILNPTTQPQRPITTTTPPPPPSKSSTTLATTRRLTTSTTKAGSDFGVSSLPRFSSTAARTAALVQEGSVLPLVLGVVLGILLLLALIAVITCYCTRRRKRMMRRAQQGSFQSRRSSLHLLETGPKDAVFTGEENDAYYTNSTGSLSSRFNTLVSVGSPSDKPLLFVDTTSGHVTSGEEAWEVMQVTGVTADETTDEATLRRIRTLNKNSSEATDIISYSLDKNGHCVVQWSGAGDVTDTRSKKKNKKAKQNKKDNSKRASRVRSVVWGANDEKRFLRMCSTNSQKALLTELPQSPDQAPDWSERDLAHNDVLHSKRKRTQSEGDAIDKASDTFYQTKQSVLSQRSESLGNGLEEPARSRHSNEANTEKSVLISLNGAQNKFLTDVSSTKSSMSCLNKDLSLDDDDSKTEASVTEKISCTEEPLDTINPVDSGIAPRAERTSIADKIRGYEQMGWCTTLPHQKSKAPTDVSSVDDTTAASASHLEAGRVFTLPRANFKIANGKPNQSRASRTSGPLVKPNVSALH